MKAYPSCLQELHPPYLVGGESFSPNIITSRFNMTTNITGKKTQDISSITCSVMRPIRGDSSACISDNAERSLVSEEEEEPESSGPADAYSDLESEEISNEDGVTIRITKTGKRSRKIESSVRINAGLSMVWNVLTDYEKLADFIPGLALSRLLEKRDNYVRLFQIGQQNVALGLKFNAKAVLDCFEMELEDLSGGQKRDIVFKMVEGDFEMFQGKWSVEQYDSSERAGKEFNTVLSYAVDVEPKLWVPVRLVEGRLCKEIITNLSCLRNEAHIRSHTFIHNSI